MGGDKAWLTVHTVPKVLDGAEVRALCQVTPDQTGETISLYCLKQLRDVAQTIRELEASTYLWLYNVCSW